jgi:hypothetical protein
LSLSSLSQKKREKKKKKRKKKRKKSIASINEEHKYSRVGVIHVQTLTDGSQNATSPGAQVNNGGTQSEVTPHPT